MTQANVSISVEDSSPVTRTFRVEVPLEQVQKAHQTTIEEYRRQVRIPGFRPGKAPTPVVIKNYKSEIDRSVQEQLIRESIGEAVESYDGKVLGVRDVNPDTFEAKAAFVYRAVVEVPPEFKLQSYKKMKLERPYKEASEADIDKVLADLQLRNAEFADADAGYTAADGDQLTVDYTATADGEVINDGEQEDYLAVIGGPALHAEFSKQLIGKTAGSDLAFEITYGDDDAPQDDLKGKTAQFKVAVKSIQKRVLPKLDDAFAAKMLPDANLESLRQRIRDDFQNNAESEAKRALELQVYEQMLEAHPFDVPEGVVEKRQRDLAEETAGRLMQQGYPKNALKNLMPMVYADTAKRAANDVRVGFLMDAVAEAESITADDSDAEAALASIAEAQGQSKEAVIARAKENDVFDQVLAELKQRKALDFIIEHATIKDVDPEAFQAARAKKEEAEAEK